MAMRRALTLPTLAVAAAAAGQLGATECGEALDDTGFDHWCDDRLCFWELERGEVRRVPTWIDGDDGVEFVGDDVAISQLAPVTSDDTDCVRLSMVADIAGDAAVELHADVFGDGTLEAVVPVPAAAWERRVAWLGLRGSYEGVRLRLTKRGPGRAVLAQLSAEVADGCGTWVDVPPRPLGAACVAGADCASGRCAQAVCAACIDDADCPGEVCGRTPDAPAHLAPWRACVPAGGVPLGGPCLADGECATGACNGLACSECVDAAGCGGARCGSPADAVAAWTCDGPPRPPGTPCVVDAQCASGACDGAPLGACDPWGLDLCREDDDCPADDALHPGACAPVSVTGGVCR